MVSSRLWTAETTVIQKRTPPTKRSLRNVSGLSESCLRRLTHAGYSENLVGEETVRKLESRTSGASTMFGPRIERLGSFAEDQSVTHAPLIYDLDAGQASDRLPK